MIISLLPFNLIALQLGRQVDSRAQHEKRPGQRSSHTRGIKDSAISPCNTYLTNKPILSSKEEITDNNNNESHNYFHSLTEAFDVVNEEIFSVWNYWKNSFISSLVASL